MSASDEVSYDSYRIWKRNAPLLYDLCITHVLTFPTLTLDFQPWCRTRTVEEKVNGSKRKENVSFAVTGVVFGTNTPLMSTNTREKNYIFVKELYLPLNSTNLKEDCIIKNEHGAVIGGYGASPFSKIGAFHDLHWLGFTSECNALAVCPHDGNIIAALSNERLYLYDLKQLYLRSDASEDQKETCVLEGISAEGFSLEFSKTRPYFLAAGGSDGHVYYWDANTHKLLGAVSMGSNVNGISISEFCPAVLAAVTDNGFLHLINTNTNTIATSYALQNAIPTSCSFSPHNQNIIIVGDESGAIHIFDIRCLSSGPLYTLSYHTAPVYQLKWSPFYANLFASGGEDARVVVWDITGKSSSINDPLKYEAPQDTLTRTEASRCSVDCSIDNSLSTSVNGSSEPEVKASCEPAGGPPADQVSSDAPPEVAFVHAGHTTYITAIAWHPTIPNMIASAAEDNSLHFWWPAEQYLYLVEGFRSTAACKAAEASDSK